MLKDGKIQRTFKEKDGVDDFHVIEDESGEKLAIHSSFLLRDYAENALPTEPREIPPTSHDSSLEATGVGEAQ